MTNEMNSLVKAHPLEGLWMQTAPVPEVGPDDVLIRINKTGICGTDIHIWNWDEWAQKTIPVPLITGHEFAGVIVELGRNVKGLILGQRCSGEGHLIGKQSRQSRAGKFHLDPETRGIGVNEHGAFAEYLRLPAFNVVPLPDEINDDIGAILDPLGNAVHTALSFDLLGEDVLITGAGTQRSDHGYQPRSPRSRHQSRRRHARECEQNQFGRHSSATKNYARF